jgi:hypothetical protein
MDRWGGQSRRVGWKMGEGKSFFPPAATPALRNGILLPIVWCGPHGHSNGVWAPGGAGKRQGCRSYFLRQCDVRSGVAGALASEGVDIVMVARWPNSNSFAWF